MRDFRGLGVLNGRMNQTIVIGVAALLAGAGGGFLIGRSNGEADASAHNTDEAAPPAKIRRDGPESTRNRPSGSGGKSFAEIMREPGQSARLQALIDLYAGMDPVQLEAEAEKLDGLPMGDRILASVLLFSRWAEIDPQGAMSHANGMGFGGRFAKPTILRSWASVDPVNAAKYYTENPDEFDDMGRGRGPRGDAGSAILAREWAKLDPTAAMEWAEGLEGSDRTDAVVSVIGEVSVVFIRSLLPAFFLGALDGVLERLTSIFGDLILDQDVRAIALLGVFVIDQRIIERIDVTRSLPYSRMHQNRGIKSHNVLMHLSHGLPPGSNDVTLEL